MDNTTQILRTDVYDAWFKRLKDLTARARIASRVTRLQEGNSGDAKGVGSGVMELRIDSGPGYRVYYIQRRQTLILLLCGGDKSTQGRDIERAKALATEPYNEEE